MYQEKEEYVQKEARKGQNKKERNITQHRQFTNTHHRQLFWAIFYVVAWKRNFLKPRLAKINEAFVASCFFQRLAFVLAFHEKNFDHEL